MRGRRSVLSLALLAFPSLGCSRVLGIEELRYHEGAAGASGDPPIDGPSPPSCENLEPRCGARHDDDCCKTLSVPGGEFLRAAGYPASIRPFALDKYEVTVARFRAFVASGFGTQEHPPEPNAAAHPAIDGSGWEPRWNAILPESPEVLEEEVRCNDTVLLYTSSPDSHDERPMNCLSWAVAFAFCAWDGGRLPTEAEWAFAASGGAEQRSYPWGETAPDGEHASYGCTADGVPECVLEDVLGVGQLPNGAGRWKHLDLAGNIGEWVLDADEDYPLPCTDCAALGSAFSSRIYRGGTFDDASTRLKNSERGDGPSTAIARDVGVRCARDRGD